MEEIAIVANNSADQQQQQPATNNSSYSSTATVNNNNNNNNNTINNDMSAAAVAGNVAVPATSAASSGAAAAAPANNYEDLFPALPDMGSKPPNAGLTNSTATKMRVGSSTVTQVFYVPFGERKFDSDKFGEGESVRTCHAIMKDTGAHIELSSGKDQSLTFLVSGKLSDVLEARRKILVHFQTQASKTVPIPREHHRWILGKKG